MNGTFGVMNKMVFFLALAGLNLYHAATVTMIVIFVRLLVVKTVQNVRQVWYKVN